jgi:hypothetical protein
MLFLGRVTWAVVLIAAFSTSAADKEKKEQRGARVIELLDAQASACTNREEWLRLQRLISETRAALRNNNRPPAPEHIDVFQLPFVHYRYAFARVGTGNKPATNLRPSNEPDSSKIDPLPSTFWSRPANIATQDLRAGFGRAAMPVFENRVWNYAAPKTSYGGHAGFEAKCGNERIKIKFGEIHSEPFTARIFHALGYYVDPTDFSPGLKVRYDRRLFAEFNSRKPVDTQITTAGVLPVWTIHFQPNHDPFRFIAGATLKDGRRISVAELQAAMTNAQTEAEIDYILTAPANVQLKDRSTKSIGLWDFGQLGHEGLRELRGAGLLAAWLGWFDSRFENTRLKCVEHDGRVELKHYFTDLGGGLGKRSSWSGRSREGVEAFPDYFTKPEIFHGKGRMTIPFRVVNFRPIERTAAFEQMTIDDARWMARLIAQLSREQISDALAASGFSGAEVNAFAAKLCSRRDRMLKDLGLDAER